MTGRIPQPFIDELLDRVDLVELIDSRIKLRKSGKNYMACCPFHDEKSPSFSVNAEKQFYHCFGCGESGNAIGFLMAFEHREFVDVVESLARQQGLEVPRENSGDEARFHQRQDLYTVLDKANRFYQEQLRSHPQAGQAQDYLQQRGLTSQVAHQFGVGYAPGGWDNLLRFFQQDGNEAAQSRNLLLQAGMLVEKEGDQERAYDRFRQRIMFPIRDVRGRVIGFGGRVLSADEKPKYLNSPETEVFHKGRELYGLYEALQANRNLQRILVVEGYMDVVALAQYGITFATATLGTAASAEHLNKAFRHVPEVVFCFDGDEAGKRAAQRALEVSLPALTDGRQVKFLFVPDGEDPDSLVRKLGKEDFLQRLDEAQPLSEFLFDVAGKGLRLERAEDRSRLVAKTAPLIRQLPEGIYKNQLKQWLASKSQSDVVDLQPLLASVSQNQPVSRPSERSPAYSTHPKAHPWKAVEANASKPGRLSLWDEAVSLLLQQSTLLDFVDINEGLGKEGLGADAERFFRLVELLKQKPEASINKIVGLWQGLHGSEDARILYSLADREILLDQAGRECQFRDLLKRLKGLPEEQRLEALIEKSRQQPLNREEKQELSVLLSQGKGVRGKSSETVVPKVD